jgi:predicted Zn finger-like uncharacterized protein
MIVTCTRCQSKFRVADEKVGPRGVKVRCSRCQTVFPVRRETPGEATAVTPGQLRPQVPPPLPPRPTSSAPLDLDLEQDGARPGPAPDPFAAQDPFAPRPSAPDPFAASSAAAPDPFARGDAAAPDAPSHPAASPDPFGPASSLSQPALADPFVASVVPRGAPPGGGGPPVTDLSDLLGASTPARPAAPPPEEPAPETPFGSVGEEGLSLEERTTPPPLHQPLRDVGGGDPFGAPGAFGELDLGSSSQIESAAVPALAVGFGEAGSFAEEAAPRRAVAPRSSAPRSSAPRGHAPPATAPLEDPVDVAERIRRRRGARLRSIAVNAVSLSVLVLAALAIVLVFRGEAPLDRALRPSAILGALGRGPPGTVAAVDLSNGLYERARGAPVLFVRGRVVSRAAAPLGRVRVAVEVVREGEVLAHGDALAGALPTPEELHGADDAAALALLATSLEARAARSIPPGESVPFLVAIAEYPADLSGATVRVTATPEGRGGR